MLTVHHLNESRSQRILWLLGELEVPYDIAWYERDPKTRLAQQELKSVHPLGKSPVIADHGRVVAWVRLFQQRPAYREALERGGPYPLLLK
jgi:glutathione S-transferase